MCAEFVGSGTPVVTDVFLDAQVVNGQRGLVRGALDLESVTSAIADGLRLMFKDMEES